VLAKKIDRSLCDACGSAYASQVEQVSSGILTASALCLRAPVHSCGHCLAVCPRGHFFAPDQEQARMPPTPKRAPSRRLGGPRSAAPAPFSVRSPFFDGRKWSGRSSPWCWSMVRPVAGNEQNRNFTILASKAGWTSWKRHAGVLPQINGAFRRSGTAGSSPRRSRAKT